MATALSSALTVMPFVAAHVGVAAAVVVDVDVDAVEQPDLFGIVAHEGEPVRFGAEVGPHGAGVGLFIGVEVRPEECVDEHLDHLGVRDAAARFEFVVPDAAHHAGLGQTVDGLAVPLAVGHVDEADGRGVVDHQNAHEHGDGQDEGDGLLAELLSDVHKFTSCWV